MSLKVLNDLFVCIERKKADYGFTHKNIKMFNMIHISSTEKEAIMLLYMNYINLSHFCEKGDKGKKNKKQSKKIRVRANAPKNLIRFIQQVEKELKTLNWTTIQ